MLSAEKAVKRDLCYSLAADSTGLCLPGVAQSISPAIQFPVQFCHRKDLHNVIGMKLDEEKVNIPDRKAVELVQRAVHGDQDALADLFHRLNEPVLNYVYRMVGDRPTAEDITQDAFIRAHHRIDQLGPPWDFKSWVYRIAGNLAIDHLRKARRFVDVEEVELIGSSTTRRPAEKKAQMQEQQQAVWKTLDGLPTTYRQALVLREFNELSYEELSLAMEVSYDSARQIVHRARMKFKDLHGIRLFAQEARQRCMVLDDMLSAYHDGELPESELKKVKKHIKSCKDCQTAEKEMQKVSAMLAVIPPLVPTALWRTEVLGELLRHGKTPKVKVPDQLSKSGAGQGGSAQPAASVSPAASPAAGAGSLVSKAAAFFSSAWPLIAVPVLGVAAVAAVLLFANLGPGGPGGYGGGTEPTPQATAEASQAAAVLPEESSTPQPSGFPQAAATSTTSVTATLEPATVTGQQNVKCRYGPDTVFEILTYLMKDESALVAGRNSSSSWWYIERPDGHGYCWVWDGVVAKHGDFSMVPVVASPPTPRPPTDTPEPVDTEAPYVEISLSPYGGGHPTNHDVVTFTASAVDNIGVTSIEIWMKSPSDAAFSLVHTCRSSSVCVYSSGPYEAGILTYQARAFDAAGNEGLTLKKQVEVVIILY